MGDQEKIEILDKLLADERGSIKLSLVAALGVFFIGAIISTIIYIISLPAVRSAETHPSEIAALKEYMLAIPPLITTFLTGFPLKEYLIHKKRITYGRILRDAYQSPPVLEKIEERFWTFMDKTTS